MFFQCHSNVLYSPAKDNGFCSAQRPQFQCGSSIFNNIGRMTFIVILGNLIAESPAFCDRVHTFMEHIAFLFSALFSDTLYPFLSYLVQWKKSSVFNHCFHLNPLICLYRQNAALCHGDNLVIHLCIGCQYWQ